jgi:rsbT co-antagonist protein RsbR
METTYLLFFPLFILIFLMAYTFSRNPRGLLNRIFALYMLNISLGTYAILVMATTTSSQLATAAATTVVVTIFVLTIPFIISVIMGLYYPRHLFRWYGLPLLAGLGIVFAGVVIADAVVGWELFCAMPSEMGTGYISTDRYMCGSLVSLLYAWFFGGMLLVLVLLGITWVRSPQKERPVLSWLIASLLASGLTALIPPHPLSAALNPLIFSVVFVVVVTRYGFLQPSEISVGAVVQGASAGMILCDQEGRINQLNPVAAAILGVSGKEASGRPFDAVFGSILQQFPQDEGMQRMNQAVAERFTQPFETLLKVEQNERRVLAVSGVPIRDQHDRHAGSLLTLRDVTDQERVREAMEAKSRLAQMLREISAPIVPVAERILILPLVGAIDTERAQNMMTDMLESIRRHRARAILIDITGVPVVDTMVANALIRAVQAARLLGCEGILVGINAEIAHTIVQLGLDLGGLVTKGSLQEGLKYALSLESGETASHTKR